MTFCLWKEIFHFPSFFDFFCDNEGDVECLEIGKL